MQISRRGNVLQGGGEHGSCHNCQSLACSWIVWQFLHSPVSPCCQFPRLLPLCSPSSCASLERRAFFRSPPACTFTGRVCKLCPSSVFFSKPPLWVKCSCFTSKSPRLLPAGDVCMGWANLMVGPKTISLGTLRGAKPAPACNQSKIATTKPADGQLSSRTLILCEMWIFLFPRFAKEQSNPYRDVCWV